MATTRLDFEAPTSDWLSVLEFAPSLEKLLEEDRKPIKGKEVLWPTLPIQGISKPTKEAVPPPRPSQIEP